MLLFFLAWEGFEIGEFGDGAELLLHENGEEIDEDVCPGHREGREARASATIDLGLLESLVGVLSEKNGEDCVHRGDLVRVELENSGDLGLEILKGNELRQVFEFPRKKADAVERDIRSEERVDGRHLKGFPVEPEPAVQIRHAKVTVYRRIEKVVHYIEVR